MESVSKPDPRELRMRRVERAKSLLDRLWRTFRRGPVTARPNDGYWKHVEELLPGIIDENKHKMDSPPVEPVVLTKLIVHAVAGFLYYPTLCVKGEDGVTNLYEAKVWYKVANLGTETLYFKKVSGEDGISERGS